MRATIVAVLVMAWSAVDAKPAKKAEPRSIVFVIDRSGSMKGAPLEAAKEGVLAAIESLAPTDRASLVVFDTAPRLVFAGVTRAQRPQVNKLVDAVTADGGTDVKPALATAFALLMFSPHKTKHVIVLTDGEAPFDGIVELLEDMQKLKITVSAIGISGADRNLLSQIADHGAGRLYMVEDLGALPKIFIKETRD